MITENDGKRKNVGVLNTDTNMFFTYRDGKKHLLRKYNAWALDKKLVDTVLKSTNALIVIVDTTTKIRYTIETNVFISEATLIEFHQHRPQLYLNKERFNVSTP